jgi:tellurite resistance protein
LFAGRQAGHGGGSSLTEAHVTTPKIPLNFFGIPFGLAGLGEAWTVLAGERHAPALVGEIILLVAAVSWLAAVAAYLSHLITARVSFSADLLDPIASPFASLALIVPVLLASDGLYPHAPTPGRVITDLFIALTVLLGSWFTGQWIYRPVELDRFHPGYFLPTVAGGLIASGGAALVGQQRLAEVLLGLGVVSWLVVGSLILGRLFFRPMLPPPLQPTLAIEVAPAAVTSLAWFAIHGDHIDAVTAFLAGYGMLMVLAQLRLLPAYRRLTFMPSFWAFTFSWAAVATAGIIWLQSAHPAGYRVWQYVLIAAITALVGAIAIRTVIAIARHQFLPRPPASPSAATPVSPSAATGSATPESATAAATSSP